MNKKINSHFPRLSLLLSVFVLLLIPYTNHAQCDPDTQAPFVACNDNLNVYVTETPITVTVDMIGESSNDNCTADENLQYRLEFGADYTGDVPTTTFVQVASDMIGQEVEVVLWVGDESNNWSVCFSVLTVDGCNDLLSVPYSLCPTEELAHVFVNEDLVNNTFYISPEELVQEAADLCTAYEDLEFRVALVPGIDQWLTAPPTTTYLDMTGQPYGLYYGNVWVRDFAGNWHNCVAPFQYQGEADPCAGDNVPPNAVSEASVEVQLVDGEFDLYAHTLDAGSNDNCTAADDLVFRVQFTDDFNDVPPTLLEGYKITITDEMESEFSVVFWVRDNHGNWNGSFTNVTIFDEDCANDIVIPELSCTEGMVFTAPASIGGGDISIATDNCSEQLSYQLLPWDQTIAEDMDIEGNYLFTEAGAYVVSVVVTDEAGNEANCTAEIIISDCSDDSTAPVAICESELTVAPGSSITVADINENSYDNCTSSENLTMLLSFSDDIAQPDDDPLHLIAPEEDGVYYIALWVEDENGNNNQCYTTLTVEEPNLDCNDDTESPNLSCTEGMTFVAPASVGGATVSIATDNCSEELTYQLLPWDQTIPQDANVAGNYLFTTVGEYAVAVIATDEAGNESSCTTTIMIVEGADCENDTEAPSLVCNEGLTFTAPASIGATDIAIATDNCSNELNYQLLPWDQTVPEDMNIEGNYLFTEVGDYVVAVIVTDEAGNENTCWANLTIANADCTEDTTPPIAICSNTSLSYVDGEPLSITTDIISVSAYDNCTADDDLVFYIELSADYTGNVPSTTTIDVSPIMVGGDVEVVVWVGDENDNWTTCNTVVTIDGCADIISIPYALGPPIELPHIFVNEEEGSEFYITPIELLQEATDLCTPLEDLSFRVALIPAIDEWLTSPPATTYLDMTGMDYGLYYADVWVSDLAGNWSHAAAPFLYQGEADVCAGDLIPPTAVCDANVSVELEDGEFELYANSLDEGSNDNCTPEDYLEFRVEFAEDYDGVPPALIPGYKIVLTEDMGNSVDVVFWVRDNHANWSNCYSTVTIIGGGCTEDTTPPVANCESELTVLPGGSITVSDIDEYSYDNCTSPEDLLLLLAFSDDIAQPDDDPLHLIAPEEEGQYYLALWVEDESSNSNICFTTITVEALDPNCENDTVAPDLACTEGMMFDGPVSIGGEDISIATDNCSEELSYQLLPWDQTIPQDMDIEGNYLFTQMGEYDVTVIVADEASNENTCTTTVTITCDDELNSPFVVCTPNNQIVTNEEGVTDFAITAYDLILDAGDLCTPFEMLDFRIALIPHENQGLTIAPTSTQVELEGMPYGFYYAHIWVADLAGNWTDCITSFYYEEHGTIANFSGQVFAENNDNCNYDTGEVLLENRTVYMYWPNTGQTKYTLTDVNGNYTIADTSYNVLDTVVVVGLINTTNIGLTCPITYEHTTNVGDIVTGNHDFAIHFESNDEECPVLSVDLSTLSLTHCATSQYYVSYCNNSTFEAEGGYVDVILEDYLTFVGSDMPSEDLGDNTYRFDIGSLPALDCSSFVIDVDVSCEAPVGITHCSVAFIYPTNDNCNPWDGPVIEVDANCTDDNVELTITNIGTQAMATPLNYIVIEDIVMYTEDEFQLDVAEDLEILVPANGATWRLDAEQVPGYMGYSRHQIAIEGCGGVNTPGLVNIFPFDDSPYSVSTHCEANSAEGEFAATLAYPVGYGEEHYIDQNVAIEYKLYFENLTDETLNTIVLTNEFSDYLDVTTLQVGASSHDLQVEFLNDNTLYISSNDISLAPGESGFVKLKVEQFEDNPVGSLIENVTKVYIDNELMSTQRVDHLVGEQFVIVSTPTVWVENIDVVLAPNPVTTAVNITIDGANATHGNVVLFDSKGQQVKQHIFTTSAFTIDVSDLSGGMYFFQIQLDGEPISVGKLIIE